MSRERSQNADRPRPIAMNGRGAFTLKFPKIVLPPVMMLFATITGGGGGGTARFRYCTQTGCGVVAVNAGAVESAWIVTTRYRLVMPPNCAPPKRARTVVFGPAPWKNVEVPISLESVVVDTLPAAVTELSTRIAVSRAATGTVSPTPPPTA